MMLLADGQLRNPNSRERQLTNRELNIHSLRAQHLFNICSNKDGLNNAKTKMSCSEEESGGNKHNQGFLTGFTPQRHKPTEPGKGQGKKKKSRWKSVHSVLQSVRTGYQTVHSVLQSVRVDRGKAGSLFDIGLTFGFICAFNRRPRQCPRNLRV